MATNSIASQKTLALNESIKDILSNFREMSLDERLYRVAKNAANLAGAETCGILMKNDKFLTLDASYGHKKGRFIKGMKLAIRGGRKSGLTGYIAYHGKVFSANGKELVNHPAVKGDRNHTPSGYCYSLLMVPLRQRHGKNNNQIIAWLRLDNKKGSDGKPGPDIPFTKEDQLFLNFFSSMIASALDIASLVDQLSNDQERLQRINAKLRRLYNASNILLSSGSPEQMLKRIVEEARLTMQADFVSVIILGKQGGVFELEKSWGTEKNSTKKRYTSKTIRNNGHTEYIIEHKAPVIVEDIDSYDARKYNRIAINAFTKKAGFRAILGFPLILNDEAIGVIWFHFLSRRHLDDIELELMQIYSNQAALAYDQSVQTEITRTDLLSSEKILDTTAKWEFRNSLQELVEYTLRSLSCSAVVLFQYDRSSKRLTGNPIHTGLFFPEKVQKQRDKRSIVYKILNHKSPYIVPEVSKDKLFVNRRFVDEEKIKSCVAISLAPANKPVGVMFINYRDKHEFTEVEIQKITKFANQAAISLGYLELVSQIKKQSEEIAALYVSSESILKDLSIDETLDQIARETSNVIKHMVEEDALCVSYIMSVRENELFLQSVYPIHFRKILNQSIVWIDLEKDRGVGIVGKVVKENRTINSGNVNKVQDYIAAIEGTKSQISIPLRYKNAVIGVLSIECNKPFAFSNEAKFYIESLAHHADIALEKNLLINQLSTIQESIKTITNASVVGDLQNTLDVVVNESKKALGCGGVAIYLYDETQKTFMLPETRTPLRYPENQIKWKGFGTNSFDHDVMDRGEITFVDNTNNREFFRGNKFVRAENIKALLVVPLIVRHNQKIGVMFVNYYAPRKFGEIEVSTIRLLADQASVAIHNSLLYAQAQRRADALSALYSAGTAISSSLTNFDIKNILQVICSQAKNMIKLGNDPDCFSHIALLQENSLVYVASSNQDILDRLEMGDAFVDLHTKGKIGVAGRAVIEKKYLISTM